MDKGVNTIILDAKQSITNTINEVLKQGVPVIVVNMIVESLLRDLDGALTNTIKQEQDKYEKQQEVQSEQVPYVEPTDDEQC